MAASAPDGGVLTGKRTLAYSASVADVYQALAASARRAILDELAARDGQSLFELCTRMAGRHGVDMSRQAISQHLGVLEAAGLVRTERHGRLKLHFIDVRPLQAITQRWQPKFDEE